MVKITCGETLKDLKGNETKGTVGEFLAQVLWNNRENHARSYSLATRFADDTRTEVELNAEDVVFIRKAVTSVGARAGEVGQILAILDESKK